MALDVPFADELDTCMRCGYCRAVCPTWREVGWESASPRGKAIWLTRMARQTPLDRAMGMGAGVNERFLRHFYYCTMCGMCAEVCQTSIPLPDVWTGTREWLLRRGHEPVEGHRAMVDSLAREQNPWGQPRTRRTEWMGDRRPPAESDLLWFVGCTEAYSQFQAADAGVAVLDGAGVEWTTLGEDEWCCGNPELKIGATEHIDERARHNVDAIEAAGASRVVSGCPGCVLTLGTTYRERGMGGSFETVHILELLLELVEDGAIVPQKKPRGHVIWHDPCELGRVGGRLYEAPRRLLDAICGKGNWLEFPENRDLQSCCGGGGTFKAVDDDAAVHIAARKLEDAEDLGASLLVSACPSCRFNFNHGVQSVKRARKRADAGRFNMRVMDIKELLLRSL